jgi:hypothetical protein
VTFALPLPLPLPETVSDTDSYTNLHGFHDTYHSQYVTRDADIHKIPTHLIETDVSI